MAAVEQVRIVREFNRFYTALIGALSPDYLATDISLTQMRVLYEIAHQPGMTGRDLSAMLRLDPGYLSRVLKAFRTRGWVASEADADDARVRRLMLTDAGWAAFAPMQERARAAIADVLSPLSDEERSRLVAAMGTIRGLLDPADPGAKSYLLRPPRAGDFGTVVAAHGSLYADEYGFDTTFEALVARIAADFIDGFDPSRHCCWIAERDGRVIGSVFVVDVDAETAKLRMLYVDPRARGLGVGRRLMEEAIRFARSAGYLRMTLWTNDILTAARDLYRSAGFIHTASDPMAAFGVEMVAETWDLTL